MAKNSIKSRIRITKRGKVRRRATTLGHSRANKSQQEMKRKKLQRGLKWPKYLIDKYS